MVRNVRAAAVIVNFATGVELPRRSASRSHCKFVRRRFAMGGPQGPDNRISGMKGLQEAGIALSGPYSGSLGGFAPCCPCRIRRIRSQPASRTTARRPPLRLGPRRPRAIVRDPPAGARPRRPDRTAIPLPGPCAGTSPAVDARSAPAPGRVAVRWMLPGLRPRPRLRQQRPLRPQLEPLCHLLANLLLDPGNRLRPPRPPRCLVDYDYLT